MPSQLDTVKTILTSNGEKDTDSEVAKRHHMETEVMQNITLWIMKIYYQTLFWLGKLIIKLNRIKLNIVSHQANSKTIGKRRQKPNIIYDKYTPKKQQRVRTMNRGIQPLRAKEPLLAS